MTLEGDDRGMSAALSQARSGISVALDQTTKCNMLQDLLRHNNKKSLADKNLNRLGTSTTNDLRELQAANNFIAVSQRGTYTIHDSVVT